MKGKPLRQEKNRLTCSILLHDFKNVMRQNWILMLMGLIVFSVLFPVSTCAVPDTSIFNVEYTHQQLKFRFCAAEVLILIQAADVLFGAISGMRLFSFLADKNKTSFYMSVGLKRRKLFFNRALAGILILLAGISIPIAVSVILNYAALGGYEGMFSYAVYLCAGLVVQAAAVMFIAAAACCMAGTFSEASLLGVTIAAAPMVLIYFVNVLMKTFLWGNVFGETTYAMETIEPGLTEKLSLINPVTFFFAKLKKYYFFSREMGTSDPESTALAFLILWIMALIIFAAVVCVLFCRRKSEHAGISGLSRVHNYLVTLIWPLLAFSAVLDAMGDISCLLATAGGYLCFLLIYAVILGFAAGRGMSRLKKAGYGVCLVCLVGTSILITDMGMFGYESRIPNNDNIASASLTYVGDPGLLPAAAQSSSSGITWYCDARISFTEDESIQCAKEIHKIFADSGHRRFGSSDVTEGRTDFSDTVIPYDIRIDYTLKSGKKIRRYYDRASFGQLEELLNLEESEEFKSDAAAVVEGKMAQTLWNSEAFAAGNIYITDRWLSNVSEIKLGENKRAQLLAAIASDIVSQSAEDRYFPQKDVSARLFFTLNGESDLETFGYHTSNASIWLTDSYKKTAALLFEWGVDIGAGERSEAVQQPNIESVTLQKFDPYASMNKISDPMSVLFLSYRSKSDDDFPIRQDFGTRPKLTDANQISEIVPALRSNYFMSGGGYIAAVKLTGSDQYIYKFIPYESAPDFINQKMN